MELFSNTGPFPAGAGINRLVSGESLRAITVPRRRGDQPLRLWDKNSALDRSPQARGSTELAGRALQGVIPFPAGAGINRARQLQTAERTPVPRRRGDQPIPQTRRGVQQLRSPQARGSTVSPGCGAGIGTPFPAGAGINRSHARPVRPPRSVPRRRGDQPNPPAGAACLGPRSPQARGSTAPALPRLWNLCPFPAGAGINRWA